MVGNRHVFAVVSGLGVALALGACASSDSEPREFIAAPPAASATGAARVAEDHRLAPSDKVRVNVFRQPDLSVDVAVVDAKGQIVLPLLGPIDVAGKTRDELTAFLTTELKRDLVNPNVTVMILETATERVALDGAVRTPGLLAVNGSTTLLRAITQGGGPDRAADLSNVLVIRTSGEVRKGARFDLNAIRKGRAEDPEILPGDTIFIASSRVKSIWGQVLTSLPVLGVFTAF